MNGVKDKSRFCGMKYDIWDIGSTKPSFFEELVTK